VKNAKGVMLFNWGLSEYLLSIDIPTSITNKQSFYIGRGYVLAMFRLIRMEIKILTCYINFGRAGLYLIA
jgi:hypothetical protein